MNGDEADLVFAAGVRYAADSIVGLIDELALCTDPQLHCPTCQAYRMAAHAVTKWLDAELEEREARL